MILAIDIGTTFLKVAGIDFNGKINFFQKCAVDVKTGNGKYEVDPNNWSLALVSLCSSIPVKLMKQVKAVVISGNGPTIVPVDSTGEPVGNAYLWMDNRANSVTDEIQSKLGEFLPPNFFLSKIYWLSRYKSDIYSKADSFLACPEYLSFVMTGEKYTLLPEEGFKGFYWNDEKISKLELDKCKFPGFISAKDQYGTYNGNLDIEGLDIGTPIICGGPDFLMSVLGSGSISQGIICDRTGTSEGLNYCSSKPYNIDGLRTLPHLVPGLFTISGLIPLSGEYVLSDQEDLLIKEYSNIINKMISEGLPIKEIRIIGGHAGLTHLNELKAKSFPIPIKVYPEGSDLIGNGVLGSVVIGHYSTLEVACNNMIKEKICYNV